VTPDATPATNSTSYTWSPWPPQHGRVAQRFALIAAHKAILAALGLPEPARYFDFTTSSD